MTSQPLSSVSQTKINDEYPIQEILINDSKKERERKEKEMIIDIYTL